MNLNELLELAQTYHPSAKITRLTKIGSRIVFYGGLGDSSQFAIDLNIDAPKVEQLHMDICVRSNFMAELLSDYDKKFPLVANIILITINGTYLVETKQILVSSVDSFEKWIDKQKNIYYKTPSKIKWAVTNGEYLPWKDGFYVTDAVLTRTTFDI